MILILTPTLKDFKKVCYLNQIRCSYNFNGFPNNPTIRWVNGYKRLVEEGINPIDKVYYGYELHDWSAEELERIRSYVDMKTRYPHGN